MPNVVPENFFYASTFPLRALRRRTSHNIADGIFLFLHLTTECGSERNNNGRFVYLVSCFFFCCCFCFCFFFFFSDSRPVLSCFVIFFAGNFPATCAAPVSLTCICRRTPSPKRNILVLERGRFSAGPRDAGHVRKTLTANKLLRFPASWPPGRPGVSPGVNTLYPSPPAGQYALVLFQRQNGAWERPVPPTWVNAQCWLQPLTEERKGLARFYCRLHLFS